MYKNALLSHPNSLNVYDSSKFLFVLYNRQGNKDEALKYAQMYLSISDSLDLGKRQEQAATVNNQFQYHLDKQKEEQTKEKAMRYRYMLIIVSLVAGLVISCIVIYVIYKRNKNYRKFISMSENMKELHADKERLQEANQSYITMLHRTELEDKAGDVVEAFAEAASGKRQLTERDWKQLYKAVDEMFPDFKSLMAEKLDTVNEQQIQMCYLLHIGLTAPQIQRITDIPRATVYRWVKKFSWAGNHPKQ